MAARGAKDETPDAEQSVVEVRNYVEYKEARDAGATVLPSRGTTTFADMRNFGDRYAQEVTEDAEAQ